MIHDQDRHEQTILPQNILQQTASAQDKKRQHTDSGKVAWPFEPHNLKSSHYHTITHFAKQIPQQDAENQCIYLVFETYGLCVFWVGEIRAQGSAQHLQRQSTQQHQANTDISAHLFRRHVPIYPKLWTSPQVQQVLERDAQEPR